MFVAKLVAPLTVVLALGCAGPLHQLTASTPLDTSGGALTLRHRDDGHADAQRLAKLIPRALARATRWGVLHAPLSIWVVPDHSALEAAARRHGYPWLRAWARYDTLYVQAPSTWWAHGPDLRLEDVLTHEFTHVVMFQRLGSVHRAHAARVPLWFREGLATWTASQGPELLTFEELARRWPHAGVRWMLKDEINAPEAFELTYSASHHAFAHFVRRFGEPAVVAVLELCTQGLSFDDAFAKVAGMPMEEFLLTFERFVTTRAFRAPQS